MVQVTLTTNRRIELAVEDYGCSVRWDFSWFNIYKPSKLLGFIPWGTKIARGYLCLYSIEVYNVHPEHKELVYNISSAVNKIKPVKLLIDGLEKTDFEYLLKD